jgi:hypothetical protein
MKVYKVKVTSIDYCIEEEDVMEDICEDASIEEDSEEFYDAIHTKIEEIRNSLPQTMELEIECEPDELDYLVCEAVSEETGWLNYSVTYKILEEK